MATKINIIRELRLVICGMLFGLILKIAPGAKDPEGLIIILAVKEWATKNSAYLKSIGAIK